MQETAVGLNKDIGAKLDRITTNQGMSVLCNTKIVTYRKSISVPISSMPENWVQRTQMQWNQIYCENIAYGPAIKSGWKIAMTMVDVNGRMQQFVAHCD